jgi:hypothetical protein
VDLNLTTQLPRHSMTPVAWFNFKLVPVIESISAAVAAPATRMPAATATVRIVMNASL